MSKPTHTPGPWNARPYNDEPDVVKAPECLADRFAPIIICECKQVGEDGGPSMDALLIAAAPDLLKALQYVRRFVKPIDVDTAYLDEVIARAKGETP